MLVSGELCRRRLWQRLQLCQVVSSNSVSPR